MTNFSITQFMLQSILFLAFQQCIIANTNNCNTLKLGPKDKLVVTIFDNGMKNSFDNLVAMCEAVKKFPRDLVSLDYKAGALATGSVNGIKCASSDCKVDKIQGCFSLFPNYNSCYEDTSMDPDYAAVLQCYCGQEANKILLDNAALRSAWKIPGEESAMPALAMNKVYDPCATFKGTEEFSKYLCLVYQKKVGPCG